MWFFLMSIFYFATRGMHNKYWNNLWGRQFLSQEVGAEFVSSLALKELSYSNDPRQCYWEFQLWTDRDHKHAMLLHLSGVLLRRRSVFQTCQQNSEILGFWMNWMDKLLYMANFSFSYQYLEILTLEIEAILLKIVFIWAQR
jgi:hypothetical protein